jgi:uncharacterized membrane protein
MQKIIFINDSAKRLYDGYIQRVERQLNILSAVDKQDLLQEINSHIYEGLQRISGKDEVEKLLDITEKLGNPEDFLKPLVANKKLDEAVRSFRPSAVFQAIMVNLKSGIVFSFFAFLYLLLGIFALLIFAKIFFPSHTGLFLENNKFAGFGIVLNTTGYTDSLGYWIIPALIVICIIFYFIITLMLRLTKK